MGQVTGYALDADGHGVTIDVFVAAPFDRAVDVDARWWQAGGLGLQLGAGGMKLDTPSIAALLGGALAFASPPGRASSIQHRTAHAFAWPMMKSTRCARRTRSPRPS